MPPERNLTTIASKARLAFEGFSRDTKNINFENFPIGSCGIVSEMLGRALIELEFQDVLYICGMRGTGDDRHSHAWVTVGPTIIDITADQFGQQPVIVTLNSTWHQTWNSEPPRPPICEPKNWAVYPFDAWAALERELIGDKRKS
jgi:hypothetical protein